MSANIAQSFIKFGIGTHTTEQVVLKVEAEVIAALLNDAQDLITEVQSVLRSFLKLMSRRRMLLTLRASAVTYNSEVSISSIAD